MPGVDAVRVTPHSDKGYVNGGLNVFSRNDVMFDVEHGVVGFAPCDTFPADGGPLFEGVVGDERRRPPFRKRPPSLGP